jgi:hypothetical protein
MRIRIVAASVGVIAIIVAVAMTPPRVSKVRFRICGHPEDRWDRFQKLTGMRFGATHCCSSARVIVNLREIELAQVAYQMDHGKYATSLNQLSNELVVLPKFQFKFTSDGTNWSFFVPQQGLFAGNYLLTSDHLYFNSAATPSTNDPELWRRR